MSEVSNDVVNVVKVKPLVWERHWPGCYTVKSMKADDNGCDVVYSAEKSNIGGFIVNTVTKPGYFRCWIDFGAEFHSIHEAKAAAQADYEARILAALEPQPITVQDAAVSDVLAERARQVGAEGWTPEHDDAHDTGEMAQAAACYALNAAGWKTEALRGCWPVEWMAAWFKPTTPRRDLVKAAALILAEIERLDRAALRTIAEQEGE